MKRGFTLLLVEDDANDVVLFSHALNDATARTGVDVALHVAEDGEEAIQCLSGDGKYADRPSFPFPELIILDLKMPRATGLEVLAWLKDHEEFRRVPKILLSSSSMERDVDEAYRLGVNTFFQKPSGIHAFRELLFFIVGYWALTQRPVISHADRAKTAAR